ncbi:MAG: MarR family transcriptional regulator [Actinobacteria bacterium]|nr:MarR family transcriptional regulator [Actinomycetota bacterium]MCL5674934.1 MarR family transcriptional regulator [Candidatus Omnitrophota bacterium]
MKNNRKECARVLLEVMPQMFCAIKEVVLKEKFSEFSMPQFRTLRFIRRNKEISLSNLSKHLGTGLPSTSKLIDGLVEKKLIKRERNNKDRRYITITLTDKGKTVMDMMQKVACNYLGKKISPLSDSQYSLIIEAMKILKSTLQNNNKL